MTDDDTRQDETPAKKREPVEYVVFQAADAVDESRELYVVLGRASGATKREAIAKVVIDPETGQRKVQGKVRAVTARVFDAEEDPKPKPRKPSIDW